MGIAGWGISAKWHQQTSQIDRIDARGKIVPTVSTSAALAIQCMTFRLAANFADVRFYRR